MLGRMQDYVCIEWRLVGIINPGEAFDLTGAGFGIEAFGVAPFSNGKRRMHMYFNERNAGRHVARSHAVTIGRIWADHANNGNDA